MYNNTLTVVIIIIWVKTVTKTSCVLQHVNHLYVFDAVKKLVSWVYVTSLFHHGNCIVFG